MRPATRGRRDRGVKVRGQAPGRGRPADREAVVRLDLGGHPLPAELGRPGRAGPAHRGPQVRVAQQAADRPGQLAGIVGFHQQGVLAPPDDPLVAMDVGAHDRRSGGHCLEQDDPERFAAGGRRDEDVRRLEQLDLLGVADPPEELDVDQPAGQDVAPGLALLRPRADDEEPAGDPVPAQDPVRLEQLEQALARLMAPDEQEVEQAVLPAGDRYGPFEAGQVDSVRDHLVVARKVAIDEVPGRRADRDSAVQPGRVALHEPAPELVRGREAGIGMEGGDVHAPRLAQEDEREEGHERLVEVEQVEALPIEHLADLADVAGRDGDRSDRAVRGHAEALAQADHVPLGGPLQAVAAADDPDVVAPQAEILVEVADVLVDPAGDRVDVGRDQADLHRAGRSDAVGRGSPSGSNRGGRACPPG